MNVETNVARTFLYLVRKHFPVGHGYRKIFNKNNLKVSYRCMDNMGRIIKSHNAKIGKPEEEPEPCNCQASRTCPLDGNCTVSNVIYQAEVYLNDRDPPKVYIGLVKPVLRSVYETTTRPLTMRNVDMLRILHYLYISGNLRTLGLRTTP